MDQLTYSPMLIFPMYSVACNEAYKLNVSSPGTWFRRRFFCVCTTHIADKRYTHSNNEVLLHAEGKSNLSALYTRHRSRFNVSQLFERKDLSLSTRKIADLLVLTAVLLESFNWENTQQTITNQSNRCNFCHNKRKTSDNISTCAMNSDEKESVAGRTAAAVQLREFAKYLE